MHNNLEELCILSLSTNLDDNFMYTVSAHGGLVHVAFFVWSVTTNGITTLIKNSLNLLTSLFGLYEPKRYNVNSFSASLGKKFGHRKLFTSGVNLIQELKMEKFVNSVDWLINTNLLTWWPLSRPFHDSDFWSEYMCYIECLIQEVEVKDFVYIMRRIQ